MRSLLFTPGSRPDMIDKALASDADAIIVDLEDAVAASEKVSAREQIAASASLSESAKPWFIRVNAPGTEWFEDDVRALSASRATALILPKTEDPAEVQRAEKLFGDSSGHGEGPGLLITIETTLGVVKAVDACSVSPKLIGLVFGSGEQGDLIADLGGTWTPDGTALNYPRSHSAVAGRAAKLPYILDGVFMDFRNDDGLRAECTIARRMGYSGKAAIHPRQVPIINDAFTPGAAELEWHRKVIAAFEEAEKRGVASIDLDGTMVDYAVAKRSIAVLRTVE